MGEAIVITSGKGGVGKTTLTANLGAALALLGKKTLIIDTDIGLRNLDVIMGMENRIVYDLVDVCGGKCEYKKAMIRDKRFEGLFLIPAAQSSDKSAVTPMQMKALLRKLKEEFDYIIIDCPAGIEQGFENAVAGADRAIVVAVPEVSSVRDADRIIGLLDRHGIENVALVVNRIRQKMVDEGNMLSIEDMLDILAIDLIGAVPDDESIIIGANTGTPVVMTAKSKAGEAYKNIALRVMGEKRDLIDLSEKKGIFAKILEVIRR
ncbi:MAG: septum site-determining protein MinD [Clostridia bacterium]|nr:septum site-determining protein MinD [Clostridia bacterium]